MLALARSLCAVRLGAVPLTMYTVLLTALGYAVMTLELLVDGSVTAQPSLVPGATPGLGLR